MICACGSSETKLVFGFLKTCKGCVSCPPRYVKSDLSNALSDSNKKHRSGTTYTVKDVNIKKGDEEERASIGLKSRKESKKSRAFAHLLVIYAYIVKKKRR